MRCAAPIVIGCLLVACAAVEPAVGERVAVEVVWVADGDSLRARVGGVERELRLWGIDAPEKDQPGAEAAREALRRVAVGERFAAEVVAKDDYDRLVVRLRDAEGRELNRALIAAGHAWWFRRYAGDEASFREAEAAARAARRGIWAQGEPEAPWVYRERMRE